METVHSIYQPNRNHVNPHKQPLPIKQQHGQDPYSFIDEMSQATLSNATFHNGAVQVKKRGRKKKSELKNVGITKPMHDRDEMRPKGRKRHDRFNGLSEAEVSQRTLPDHLTSNLDILIVGINPGLFAAFKGHHYAGPGNHFWKCLHLSGLVPQQLTADDDYTLVNYGIGFTNMVARPTKGSTDLTRREIKHGCQMLLEKIQKYQPKIAVFNGKLIYEVFSGKKDFPFGRQTELVDGTNTHIWVMPSSSARCAQLPRAADKVPFYQALKKFKDYLNGIIPELDDSEITFAESKTMKSPYQSDGKTSTGNKQCASTSDIGGEPGMVPTTEKKKRGRPRKGTEKQPRPEKKEKKLSSDFEGTRPDNFIKNKCYGSGGAYRKTLDPNNVQDPQKRRRGRPRKSKVSTVVADSVMGADTPPDTQESNTQPNILGTPQTQAISSVSSGYSTGTSTSIEDRRHEENGSISNTGSGGLSPSHLSFSTQSDLSSEICTAISCNSPQNPTGSNNTHAESGHDVNNSVAIDNQRANKLHTSINNMQFLQDSISHNRPMIKTFNNIQQLHPETSSESQTGSFMQYPHDNRQEHLSNGGNRFPGMCSGQEGQVNSLTQRHSYQPSYETKVMDVATKSLSVLESLVDQIPSIADAEQSPSNNASIGIALVSDSVFPLPHLSGGSNHQGNTTNEAGFLPYTHHGAVSYGSTSHYSAPYYASDLSSSIQMNSLPPTYCSPQSTPTGLMFGYGGYSQYTPSPSACPHPTSGNFHLSSSYPPVGYHPYPNSSHYTNIRSSPTPTQRFEHRLHLRQDGMDLSHQLGYGGYQI